MIRKISMNLVSSFKNPAILETDKKVNLIYGLNGTGKSTISDYLYDRSNSKFSIVLLKALQMKKSLFTISNL